MSEELKPCPFCGGSEANIEEQGKIWLGARYSEPSAVVVRHWCEPIKGQPSRILERAGRDRASAIEAWNTRHVPSEEKLWLWQNGDHFLAFRHLYPCYEPGGDPQTLGEPFGWAKLRQSFDRSTR